MQKTCFWCGSFLFGNNITKDHFISKPLANFLSIADRKRSCLSCDECNQLRGKISSLFTYLINFPRYFDLEKYARKRKRLLRHIFFFRDRVLKLEYPYSEICLIELNAILKKPAEIAGKLRSKQFLVDPVNKDFGLGIYISAKPQFIRYNRSKITQEMFFLMRPQDKEARLRLKKFCEKLEKKEKISEKVLQN